MESVKTFDDAKVQNGVNIVCDSTTPSDTVTFCVNDEVLCKRTDGWRLYFGSVVEVNAYRRKCLVRFDDSQQNWLPFDSVKRFGSPVDTDVLMCVLCKQTAKKSTNHVRICDTCGRGYHEKCTLVNNTYSIKQVIADGVTLWMCKKCCDGDTLTTNEKIAQTQHQLCSDDVQTDVTRKFPYDLNSLNWDECHQTNLEQIYCYCGSSGVWYKQMLQCARCNQWFHEACVKSLTLPLYFGDRFYLFVCAMCNDGAEFLQRLEMKLSDVVQLMLFNLNLYNDTKYYHVDKVIIPYINDNWSSLQLSQKLNKIAEPDRGVHIRYILMNDKTRFKCRKRNGLSYWGLRRKKPPCVPRFTLPSCARITETEMRNRWHGTQRVQFIPVPKHQSDKNARRRMADIMRGSAYHDEIFSREHSDSSSTSSCSPVNSTFEANEVCTSTHDKKELSEHCDSMRSSPVAFELISSSRSSTTSTAADDSIPFVYEGCAKRSVPFPKVKSRKRHLIARDTDATEPLKKKRSLRLFRINKSDDDDEVKKITTNATVLETTSGGGGAASHLPPTPPTTDPPTPPACEIADIFVKTGNKRRYTIGGGDTSDIDDESLDNKSTSSKSTLDMPLATTILAPPTVKSNESYIRGFPLPVSFTSVTKPRSSFVPVVRRLNVDDLVLGKNGEIKQKRRSKRVRRESQVAVATNATEKLNESAEQTERLVTNTSEMCACKVKSFCDLDEVTLTQTINELFGTKSRIARGDKFNVLGCRTSVTGKVEYLLQWKEPSCARRKVRNAQGSCVKKRV